MVWLTCWEQRPLSSSGHSCVCRSSADVSVCCSSTCHVAGLLIPRVSRSLLAHLVPDMLPPWFLVNFCSFFSSLWPGILTCHVFPLLATLYFFTLFFGFLNIWSLVYPNLRWLYPEVFSAFLDPGTTQGPCLSAAPVFPHAILLSWDLRMGFTGAKSGSRLGLENGDHDPDVSIHWMEGVIHIHRERSFP